MRWAPADPSFHHDGGLFFLASGSTPVCLRTLIDSWTTPGTSSPKARSGGQVCNSPGVSPTMKNRRGCGARTVSASTRVGRIGQNS